MISQPESTGGSILTGEGQTTREILADLGLIRKSLERRWKTSAESRQELLDKIEHIIAHDDRPDVLLSAAETYRKLEESNQRDEHCMIKAVVALKRQPGQHLHMHGEFGVMRVPVSSSDDEWEAGCEADQKRLTGGNGHSAG